MGRIIRLILIQPLIITILAPKRHLLLTDELTLNHAPSNNSYRKSKRFIWPHSHPIRSTPNQTRMKHQQSLSRHSRRNCLIKRHPLKMSLKNPRLIINSLHYLSINPSRQINEISLMWPHFLRALL